MYTMRRQERCAFRALFLGRISCPITLGSNGAAGRQPCLCRQSRPPRAKYVAQRHLNCALEFCTVMGDYTALWPKPRTSSDGAQLTPQSCTVE